MNVGDPLGRCQGERKYGGGNTPRKPPMRQQGVSVAIVVGGRESRPHGEGPQLARWVRRNPPECEDGEDRSMSGEHSGPQIPLRRRPYAVKAARTVTTGGMGKHSAAVRPVPTHSNPPKAVVLQKLMGPCGEAGRALLMRPPRTAG